MPHDHPEHDHEPENGPVRPRGDAADALAQLAGGRDEPEALARHAGRGKLLFLDAFSGIAGDMLLSALFDLGVPRAALASGLAELGGLDGYEAQFVART